MIEVDPCRWPVVGPPAPALIASGYTAVCIGRDGVIRVTNNPAPSASTSSSLSTRRMGQQRRLRQLLDLHHGIPLIEGQLRSRPSQVLARMLTPKCSAASKRTRAAGVSGIGDRRRP
jgi:hypothetical protein